MINFRLEPFIDDNGVYWRLSRDAITCMHVVYDQHVI